MWTFLIGHQHVSNQSDSWTLLCFYALCELLTVLSCSRQVMLQIQEYPVHFLFSLHFLLFKQLHKQMMWLGLEKQEKVNIRQKTVARISGRMGFKKLQSPKIHFQALVLEMSNTR